MIEERTGNKISLEDVFRKNWSCDEIFLTDVWCPSLTKSLHHTSLPCAHHTHHTSHTIMAQQQETYPEWVNIQKRVSLRFRFCFNQTHIFPFQPSPPTLLHLPPAASALNPLFLDIVCSLAYFVLDFAAERFAFVKCLSCADVYQMDERLPQKAWLESGRYRHPIERWSFAHQFARDYLRYAFAVSFVACFGRFAASASASASASSSSSSLSCSALLTLLLV